MREAVEVDAAARVALDSVKRVGDDAEGPQAEQVDLHQAELLDVLLVVLGDDPAGHGGALDRDEVDERRPRDQHAADVDAEVAREAVDLGAQLEEPLPPVPRHVVRGLELPNVAVSVLGQPLTVLSLGKSMSRRLRNGITAA